VYMFLDKFRVAANGTRERIRVHERKKMNSKCEIEVSILQMIFFDAPWPALAIYPGPTRQSADINVSIPRLGEHKGEC
jgi:hypothetical protein